MTDPDRTAHINGYGNPRFPQSIGDLNELICGLPLETKPLSDALMTAMGHVPDTRVSFKDDYLMQNGRRAHIVLFCGNGLGRKGARLAVIIPKRSDDAHLDHSAAIHVKTGDVVDDQRMEAFADAFVTEIKKLVPAPA